MAYSSGQITDILLKADKTVYKIGDVAYENMFSELDEAYDYERDVIFIYKKAVEYGDNYFVGTLKLDQIVERLAAKLNIYDYGTLAPIYVDVYTQVDQGLNIIYVLKTTALDLGPGLTGSTDFSQSQIDIDIDYTYLNNVYVIDERTLTINGVSYDLSANRTWNVGTVTGTGTANYMTKFTSAGVIGDSNMFFSSTASSTNWTIGSTSGAQNNITSLSLAAVTEGRFEANTSDGYHAEFTNSYGNVYILATKTAPNSDNSYILYYNGSSTSNRYLAFQTNGVERLRISHTGDVSIGGTSALAKLDIYGDVNIRTIANAVTDTDKFLVSDGGIVKYRTGAEVLSDIGGASASGFVPYTGATQDVNLGTYGLITDFTRFNTSSSNIPSAEGVMSWNSSDGTVVLSLKGNTYNLPIGESLVARVVNNTGAQLNRTDYKVVRVSSAQGQRLAVQLAQANNDANSADTLGIVCENISNNQEGFIVNVGQITEINTTGSLQGETWVDGDSLYLSPTTPGAITNVKPVAPSHGVRLGYVEYAHSQHGKIYVKIDNGYELDELHDVEPTPYVNKGVLYRDTTLNLWKSATIQTLLGYTPANQATTLTINGTTYDLSANRTWSVGTVTGTGTNNYLALWNSSTGLTTSGILQNGTSGYYLDSNSDFGTTFNFRNNATNSMIYTVELVNYSSPKATKHSYTSGIVISEIASSFVSRIFANGNHIIGNGITDNGYKLEVQGTGRFTGALTIDTIANATVDTDKFLVSDGGVVKYRTGAEILSDIGAQAAGSYVPTSRQLTINGTAYDLSADRSWSVGTITSLTGEATGSGTGAVSVTLDNTAVIGKVLTGLNLSGGGTIVSTDSILQAFGKVQNQISALVGGVMYKGVWDANVNSPSLTSSVGNKGDYYIVNVAGSTNLNGITDWRIGDWAIFNGATWDKVDNTDAVSSVNTFTGAVSLTTANIPEVTNLYYLDSRARAALSFTAGSGNYSTSTGVITIPTNTNHLTNGAGFITLTSLSASSPLSYNNLTGGFSIQVANSTQSGYLSSTDWNKFNNNIPAGVPSVGDYVFYNGSNLAYRGIIANSPLSYNSSTATFSISQATTSTNGYLSSTDWNTFNNKQNALTNPVTGTGTTNYLPKFTGSTTIGNSLVYDNGSVVTIGTTTNLGGGALEVQTNGVSSYTARSSSTTGASGGTTVVAVRSVDSSASYWANAQYNAWQHIFAVSGSTEGMRLTSTGLGIGTTSPTNTLDVTGTFRATGDAVLGGSLTTFGTSGSKFYIYPAFSTNLNLLQNYNGSAYTTEEHRASDYSFKIGTSTGLILNSSSNLGLGVSPSAWGTNPFYSLQIGTDGAFIVGRKDNGNQIQIGTNAYYDGTNWIYTTNNNASRYILAGNEFRWFNAPSGTAGSVLTWTEVMRLDGSGRLGIGTSSPSTLLEVRGAQEGVSGKSLRLSYNTTYFADYTEKSIRAYNNDLIIGTGTDGTERMRITASGNVGIGTSSPINTGTTIQTSGAAFSTTATKNSNMYGLTLVSTTNENTMSGVWFGSGNGSHWSGIAGSRSNYTTDWSTHLSFYTHVSSFVNQNDATEKMRITGDGNVGIGSTSPTAKLQIEYLAAAATANVITLNTEHTSGGSFFDWNFYGPGNATGHLRFKKANGTVASPTIVTSNQVTGRVGSMIYDGAQFNDNALIRFVADGTPALNNTPGRIEFWTTPAGSNTLSEKMRITEGGIVGIGTSSPQSGVKLDVYGAAAVAGGSEGFRIGNVGDNSAYDNVKIWYTGYNSGAPRVYLTPRSTPGSGIVNTYLHLTNSNGGSTTANNTMGLIVDGSGTFGASTSGNTTVTVSSAGACVMDLLNAQSEAYIRTTTYHDLHFRTNDTNRMIVSKNGNVGIGTTSPGAKLHVYGNLQIYSGTAGYSDALVFGSETGAPKKAIFLENYWMVYQGHDNEGHKFRSVSATGAGTDDMVITGGGNVGIGISAPWTKVDIRGTSASADATLQIVGNGISTLLLGQNSDGGVIRGQGGNNVLSFWTGGSGDTGASSSGSERMRITSGGNVGIGTSSPSDKLHVVGIINSSTSTVSGTGTLYLGTTSESRIAGRITAAPSPSYSSTGKIGFSVTTWGANTDYGLTEVMAIDMRNPDNKKPVIWMNPFGGNVGIGTTIPNANLEVAVDNASAASDTRIRLSGRGNGAYGGNQYIDFTYQDYGNYGYVYKTASIQSISSTPTGNNGYGTLVFATKNASSAYNADPTEKMRITEGGSLLVGTTSAAFSEKFQVSGAQSSNGLVIIRNDANQADVNHGALVIQNRSSYAIGNDASISFALEYSGYPHPRASIGAKTASEYGAHLVFNTRSDGSSFSEKMRISAAGNVGIGTTSPSVKLELIGDGASLYYGSGQASYGAGLKFRNEGYEHWTIGVKGSSFVIAGTGGNGGIIWAGAGTNDRVTVTSAGNVGIGTSSPAYRLEVNNSTGDSHMAAVGTAPSLQLMSANTSPANWGTIGMATTTNNFITGAVAGDLAITNRGTTAGNILFGFGTSEKMRLTSGGDLLLGITSSNPGQNNTTTGTRITSGGRFFFNNSGADNIIGANANGIVVSWRRSGEEVGYVSLTTTTTTYNTGSDYRLKEDLKDFNSLNIISKIKMYDFKWKVNDERMHGVLAHELAEVLPYAVVGEKDGERMQGVDYSKIVPVLVKAIQELKAEIEQLKNK